MIEKLIRKAKEKNYQGNVALMSTLFTKKAINHVKKELVPRYENLPAGFTRVKYLGLRRNDRARMAYIEMIGNPVEIYEKNELQSEKERLGLQTYWAWEHKILRQEQEYFQNHIQNLDAQIQMELDNVLTAQAAGKEGATVNPLND